MKTLLKSLLLILVIAIVYLLAWPVSLDPKAWKSPALPAMTGAYAVNDKLANFEVLSMDDLHGPEAITSNAKGDIYSTTDEGWIVRWVDGSGMAERWVDVGGRPLGLAFDDAQNLWIANAYVGLQKIDVNGNLSVVATEAEGVAIRYADDVVVTPNGKVYFSDASTKYSPLDDDIGTLNASLRDLMEHGLYGRIIEYDPASDSSRVIMRDLSFANGVTSSEAGDFLLIAETGNYQIWKYWLTGSNAGESEVIIENLPGFPDNVHRGHDGRFWIGLTSPRSEILDNLAAKPFLRKVIQRMPAFARPGVKPYGHILAIDENGTVLTSLQDPKGAYPATTGAWETEDYLFVSSLTAGIIARYDKAELGL